MNGKEKKKKVAVWKKVFFLSFSGDYIILFGDLGRIYIYMFKERRSLRMEGEKKKKVLFKNAQQQKLFF